jgi:hypothetical protein
MQAPTFIIYERGISDRRFSGLSCNMSRGYYMNLKQISTGFVLIGVMSLPHTACDDWACGYGGPGCSDPLVAGLCENTLVVGEEYIAIFGYGSDTGVSEATVTSVVSDAPGILQAIPTPGSPDLNYETGPTGPFDLNNGPGNGGMTLRPLVAGKANVTIALKGWDETRTMAFEVVDVANAPEGFMSMTAAERLAKCIETTTQAH